jgi:large repetitive protein
MGSFKAFGRNRGPKGRKGHQYPRRQGLPRIESLESRRLLSGSTTPAGHWTPTDTNLFDVQNGPMANLGAGLVGVYQTFVESGGNTSQLAAEYPKYEFDNGMVGMSVRSLDGDFSQFLTQLADAGMQITDSSATYDLVEGYAPINELPTIANLPLTMSGQIAITPIAYAGEYQGVAWNEAEVPMQADIARTEFNVDGTGVTVGVLSTSVNQYTAPGATVGGLAASYATGDLNPNNPVKVIQDNPNTPTDEGRAMLENIHDIAPGANLQFATATLSELSFQQNIEALQAAGSQIIVDDVGYADEPMFQDGLIAQGVDAVTQKGVTYFSAAGNEGPDSGYLSTFRSGTGTVTGLGNGTFMNFDPNGGTNFLLPITTGIANASISFEYDQPYGAQEPAGSTAAVTSNVNFYVLNAAGTIVATGNTNNVATNAPFQFVTVPTAGSYFVAIQLISGTAPGHVEFVGFNDTNGAVTVSTQYGSAGGTSYPSSIGHSTAVNTIGVAATPWWAPASSLGIGQNPLANEPFSSSGPALYVFNANGTALATPQTVDNPSVTAPDGGNTSFFEPNFTLNTTTPPFPGEPASTVNLVPASQQKLNVFFGTSSAAPNAAAVAALMLEKIPQLTPAEIRQGLESTALPMNGTAQGTWNVQSGFGMVDAVAAINAVDLLRVASTNPASGATVTASPSAITVTFNKAVNFSTITAADLTFTATPSTAITVNVGTPIAVDNPTSPTIIQFPISFTKPPGTLANGSYTFSIQSPASGPIVVSTDGKDLVASGPINFTLADVTAPTVINTTTNGRIVTIDFSKALDPSTVTLSDIFVLRQGTVPTWPPTAATLSQYTNLNNDPRTKISYAATTNAQTGVTSYVVTLDYSGLPQTEMPSDNYAIVVLSTPGTGGGVTDLVGNPLGGNFTGTFPSGANGLPQDFIQNLGLETLGPPVITSFELTPVPSNETGILGDQNTMVSQPTFIGQVYTTFPGTVANLPVYIQFSGLHLGDITLAPGAGGRGFTGNYDLQVFTDSSGTFTLTAPPLPEGFQRAEAVVVGQPDSPPLPGYSSGYNDNFRIDKTPPQITGASFTPGGATLPLPNDPQPNITDIAALTTLTLNVVDQSNQAIPALTTPALVVFPALNPATAANISNYSLINTSAGNANESQYIATATFVTGLPVLDPTNTYIVDYTGQINLTFAPGLPAGVYEFVAHTTELQYPGLTDAAGNPLDDTSVVGEGTKDFIINFDIQPTPVYITGMAFESTYSQNGSTAIGGPQSYYELPPSGGTNTRDNVKAPPTAVVIDFSNPLPYDNSSGNAINYTNDVQLIGSANKVGAQADGDFGNLGQGGLGSTNPGSGFTILSADYTVTLYNYNFVTQTSTLVQPGGTGNRLVLQLDTGFTLPADNYRVYLPNQLEPGNIDTRIYDIYNNQLDGEFLGNQTAMPSPDFPGNTISLPKYEDLLPDGTNRGAGASEPSDMSGDGVAGGAFMTAFEVVPYGNVVYANPSFVENPLSGVFSNGSMAAPYPVLAPEGDPSTAPANPNHNPNGGLNSTFFFQPGNFNVSYDRSGDGAFEQSALYAAEQLSFSGPVVVVAEPGLPQRNPTTGVVSIASFVLQAPAGNNATINDGSASVPFDTTLAFQAGAVLKMQNASLYVQNQGSALVVQGTNSNPVYFTSYNDASTLAGGPSNNNPDTTPHAGDWGGIVFRNYNETTSGNLNNNFPVDGTLQGPNGGEAVSGADAAMSIINFGSIRYGGGAVPQGSSNFYSAITAFAARPTITNTSIADSGGTGGTEAAIGIDFDSLLEDDTARGPLIRQVTVLDNSLNGIWLMSESNGFIEPTTAMTYPTNPSNLGGSQNYTLEAPLPYIVLAQLVVGQELDANSGGITAWIGDRLYIQPGGMIKFNKGSALDVLNPAASLNIGSRSYINGFDQNNDYSPLSTGFVEESASDPEVLFTSIFDDQATSPLVPNPINVTGEATTPTLTMGMWGSIGIQSGAVAVINAATFTHGGGSVNTTDFTIPSQSVLSFITNFTTFTLPPTATEDLGTHAYITNNNFFDNFDAALQIEPNGLLAGNPLTPLQSGHPFFRGNILQGNGIDGMAVTTARAYLANAATDWNYVGPVEAIGLPGYTNQTVSTVWDTTDMTYVLRGTIVIDGGEETFEDINGVLTPTTTLPVPPSLTSYGPVPNPVISLTIQSALPGTLLANGETIPSPGQSVVVKLLSDTIPNGAGSLAQFGSTGKEADESGGAGFIVGVDDAVDPPSSPLIDPGAFSEIRILGIPGNQTTGQQQVPVILTSLRDDTVGVTARGVKEYDIFNSWPTQKYLGGVGGNANYATQTLTTPEPGDGGYIYIGGNSMTEYDPTNPLVSGSFIDNADISYMTRIEVQGAGITDVYDPPGTTTLTFSDWLAEKTGYGYLEPFTGAGFIGPELTDPNAAISQLNSAMAFTIDDSVIANSADAAVFVHPGAAAGLEEDWTPNIADPSLPAPFPKRSSFRPQPVDLYMYNDVIYNTEPDYTPPGTTVPTPIPYGEGVHINSESTGDTAGESPYAATLINDTFYQTKYAIRTIAPQFSGTNSNSHVNTLAMNDIFDGSVVFAVDIEGQAAESQLQYDMFYNNVNTTTNPPSLGDLQVTTTDGDFAGNSGPVFANPLFVDPSSGNFELQSDSPAIDAARSEIGPLPTANAIYPTVNQSISGGTLTGIRTDPTTVTSPEEPGRDNVFGGFGDITDPRQLVTLPGSGNYSFSDEWAPVLTTNPAGYASAAAVPGWYNYEPITGQRDILGFIRAPQSGNPGAGYGSNPFMDIGAYQYVNLHPPQIISVTQTASAGATPTNFYVAGGSSGAPSVGANQTPWTINITFNGPIDPNTITSTTVQLVDLGSNPSQPLDQEINLSGKLSYNSATNTLIISLGQSGLTLSTDAYQITLFGSGSPVIANLQGTALSGTNTPNDSPSGVQLPLPSGNVYPGGNFFDSFFINTTPPAILPGTFKLDPASDTNIVGDNITYDASPTFDGTISEPNPTLVPVAGQTAIVDIGITLFVNGVQTTFFNASQLPSDLSQYAPYIRPDAATALTSATGTFQDTIGIDGAATGLVTNASPLPNLFGVYNVGADGLLSPLPGDDSGYYTARVRIIDQSGNQSNPNDTNAQVPFVVDTTPPTVAVTVPQPNQVITSLANGQIQFTITANKNIDLTHLGAASIQVVNAGPDGVLGTADDVTIPINPASFDVSLVDYGIGGAGAEQITFSTLATAGMLTNNLYQITLVNTPANGIRDIAGNIITNPVVVQFLVDVPSLAQNLFVGGSSYITDPAAPIGDRANPYPTISAAMTAATAGDVVAVLPGVYTEQVTMKQFVKLYSAAATSTDTTVFTTSTGDALSTIIRAPFAATAPSGTYATVTATNLASFATFTTEIAGFSIASPLLIDPASGTINPNAVGLYVSNSDLVIDKDYFVDAGTGILVTTSGASALTPSIYNDGIIGNVNGVQIVDGGATASTTSPVDVINNTFAFNTVGLYLSNAATTPLQAYVASNIFWENHDQSNARNGFAIFSTNANEASLRNNLFSGNGASETSQANATNDLGNGFDPALLGPLAANAESNLGNFTGSPAFAYPIDPRPGSDGPANFFISADFELTSASAAIDNAWETTAIPTDLLGNSQILIPGTGFGLPGYGPRDVGAFEYEGTNSGTNPPGGTFRVVTTSLVPNTGAAYADGTTLSVSSAPTTVTVTFSGNVDPQDIAATDLVLAGTALDSLNPAHAASLSWIDAHTVEFNLAGQFNSTGMLDVEIAPGSIQSVNGTTNMGYSDNVVLNVVTPVAPVTTTPTPVTATPAATPAPAPSPVSVSSAPTGHHKKKAHHVTVHHAAKPVVVIHHKTPKHVVAKPSKATQHVVKKKKK